MAGWQSGYATACKAVYDGSIPYPRLQLFSGFPLAPSSHFCRAAEHPPPHSPTHDDGALALARFMLVSNRMRTAATVTNRDECE